LKRPLLVNIPEATQVRHTGLSESRCGHIYIYIYIYIYIERERERDQMLKLLRPSLWELLDQATAPDLTLLV
jgi:hypothetical protein